MWRYDEDWLLIWDTYNLSSILQTCPNKFIHKHYFFFVFGLSLWHFLEKSQTWGELVSQKRLAKPHKKLQKNKSGEIENWNEVAEYLPGIINKKREKYNRKIKRTNTEKVLLNLYVMTNIIYTLRFQRDSRFEFLHRKDVWIRMK